jgi:hypothetical protein
MPLFGTFFLRSCQRGLRIINNEQASLWISYENACEWKDFNPLCFIFFFSFFAIGRICTHYLSSRPKPTSKKIIFASHKVKRFMPCISLHLICAKRKHLFFFQFAMHWLEQSIVNLLNLWVLVSSKDILFRELHT